MITYVHMYNNKPAPIAWIHHAGLPWYTRGGDGEEVEVDIEDEKSADEADDDEDNDEDEDE